MDMDGWIGLTGLDRAEMIENSFFLKSFSLTIATKSGRYLEPSTTRNPFILFLLLRHESRFAHLAFHLKSRIISPQSYFTVQRQASSIVVVELLGKTTTSQ